MQGAPTTKAWLDAVHVATGDVTVALQKELARHEASESQRRARLLQDQRRQAVRRLQRAVTQLRDLFVELPTAALSALGDKVKFDNVKSNASVRVQKMRVDWQEDAELLGVVVQLDGLVRATRDAIEDFPYPAVYVGQDEARQVATRLMERGLAGGGLGQVLSGVTDQVGREAERKANEFAQMYERWWGRHSISLRRFANELQDSLMSAMVA